ncbi:MAG: hypothetical protein ACOYN0_03775 [Phycisphaerales bacterium]
MFQAVRSSFAVVRVPFRVLFTAYRGAWWAFAESPKPPVGPRHSPAQGKAFEIVDSEPVPTERPEKLLRRGFRLMLMFSASAGVLTFVASGAGGLTAPHAIVIWLWATLAGWIGSYYKVRQWAASSAAPQTWAQRLASVPKVTADAAAKAGRACEQAARSETAKKAASGARAAGAWAWKSLGSLGARAAAAKTVPPTAAGGA